METDDDPSYVPDPDDEVEEDPAFDDFDDLKYEKSPKDMPLLINKTCFWLRNHHFFLYFNFALSAIQNAMQ